MCCEHEVERKGVVEGYIVEKVIHNDYGLGSSY